MLKLACKNWPINKSKSILIGDKLSDIQCADNFGIKGYLFNSHDSNLLNFVKDII